MKKKSSKCLFIIRLNNFYPCICDTKDNPIMTLSMIRHFMANVDILDFVFHVKKIPLIPSTHAVIENIDEFLKKILFKKIKVFHYDYLKLDDIEDYFFAVEINLDQLCINIYIDANFPRLSIPFKKWDTILWDKIINILNLKIERTPYLSWEAVKKKG